ncbi:MAG: hypothetical protein OFPI_05480 [Osedax symbiont Rs2]|nr:MAG: hypothetical protein OFPI_05480 [Osedax symbiont Rs2]
MVGPKKNILVINPNSSLTMTAAIRRGLESISLPENISWQCQHLSAAPIGIETAAHIEEVIPLLQQVASAKHCDALVVSCFSDPGVAQLRKDLAVPIFGIGESAYQQAASVSRNVGIISILDASVGRHKIALQQLDLLSYITADIALNLSTTQLHETQMVSKRLKEVAAQLVEKGADCLVLGCAGLADYRQMLSSAMQLPVIEPSQAALLAAAASFDITLT